MKTQTQTQTKIQWTPKHNKESDWDGIELNDPETGITHASLDHCTPEAMALIAAAPAMLEALREIQTECESSLDGLHEATLGVIAMKARKVIKNLPTGN